MATLLERWDTYGMRQDQGYRIQLNAVSEDEIRRAIAIAQAVDEACRFRDMKAAVAHNFKARADELLRTADAAKEAKE